MIECVRDLPDDADSLVHELLRCYPQRPSTAEIARFLIDSDVLTAWFRGSVLAPEVVSLNLDRDDDAQPRDRRLPCLRTPQDLAEWLECTPAQLDWLADLWRSDPSTAEYFRHYRYKLVEKRHGEFRLIEMPKTLLKRAQRKIYQDILIHFEIHPHAHGFAINKDCRSHAALHVGKQFLFLFDIAECFQSIGWLPVNRIFLDLAYPPSVASYLTALCTHKTVLSADREMGRCLTDFQQRRLWQRHLPQGAPSSPALSNAVLRRLDQRLDGLARSLRLQYSRYADDLALSGDTYRDWSFLEPLIGAICLEEGLSLNHRKSRIKQSHQRQKLVGIVVNEKLNIDRRYYDRVKAIITNCARYGIESQNRENHENFRAHLSGCIQHVKSLNPRRGEKLEQLYALIS